jgi:hypothetical protein
MMKELFLYRFMVICNIISFTYMSFSPSADWKTKVIALLYNISNIIIFWR